MLPWRISYSVAEIEAGAILHVEPGYFPINLNLLGVANCPCGFRVVHRLTADRARHHLLASVKLL